VRIVAQPSRRTRIYARWWCRWGLGYGNAHAVKPPKKFKFAERRLAYDHCHRTTGDKGIPYAFESADRLLKDFFAEVDRVIKEAQQ
jgi:hypothetical protein